MTAYDLVRLWAALVYGILGAVVLVDWLEARRQRRLSDLGKRLASARVLRCLRR